MFATLTKFFTILLFAHRCAACCVSDSSYYPRYHLAPPCGWMNDPNGFCYYKDEYHLFYQFNPNSSQEPGIAHWGHAKSPDLYHWEHLPIAMYPDQPYDISGVFSGSALIEDGTMLIMYTGNVNHANQTPDHENRQEAAYSNDGINVTKYSGNSIIVGDEYQPNFRDPKLWKHDDTYYAVLGNSFKNSTTGRALLFSSKDFFSGWKMESVLQESHGSLGYMWECPDFFEVDGKWVLLFSPQGIKPKGDKYRNLYQVGYFVGSFDYKSKLFTPLTEFKELDHGHDFYATQTILDKFNQRTVIAWMDMWEQVYPERDDGWCGQMTLPRRLNLSSDNQLLQVPTEDINTIIGDELYNGPAEACEFIKLKDNTGYIKLSTHRLKGVAVIIKGKNQTVTISYDHKKEKVTLDRGGNDGIRRTKWRPKGGLFWRIFIDASSIELFCGEGEVTFSSRFFPGSDITVQMGPKLTHGELTVHNIKRSAEGPEECNKK